MRQMEREKQLQHRYAMLQDELRELDNVEHVNGSDFMEVNGETDD